MCRAEFGSGTRGCVRRLHANEPGTRLAAVLCTRGVRREHVRGVSCDKRALNRGEYIDLFSSTAADRGCTSTQSEGGEIKMPHTVTPH